MWQDNKIFFASLLVAIVFGIGLGYHWQLQENQLQVVLHSSEPLSMVHTESSAQDLEAREKVLAPASDGQEINKRRLLRAGAKFQAMVKENGLMARFSSLAPYFPESHMGDNLLEFATLLEWYEMSSSVESKYMDELLADMNRRSQETLITMSAVFDQLPDQFSHERQQLMQYASKLKAEEIDRIAFVMKEMKRPLKKDKLGKTESTALFNSTTALRSLANIVGDDPDKIEPFVREALESHKDDLETQQALLHFFARFDPNHTIEPHRKL